MAPLFPYMTKQEFAKLARSMPGASDEEILHAAREAEAQGAPVVAPEKEPSLFERLTTPLTTLPSRVAKTVGDYLDQRSLDDDTEIPLIPGSAFNVSKGQLKGFAAGALQGVGDVASQLTSPLDLAMTLVGAGGAAAGKRGLLGISQGARALEGALNVPYAAEGAREAIEGIAEGDFGKVGAGALMGTMGAAGVRNAATHAFPPQKVTEAYMKSKGRPMIPEPRVEKLDPKQSMRIADAYEAMPHTPDDPRVADSYRAMADETSEQFKFLRDKAGVKMEPWTREGQPYANSQEMMDDVRKNNRLFYFPSEGGFGSVEAQGGNPLLRPGQSGAPVNDEFRAVHDYFGHAVEGNQFGPLGEERAYRAHVRMFPDEARPAMTTETRGQNSWVNFGPHLRDASGSVPKKGEPGFVRPQDRPFAEQKTGLLPEEFVHRPTVAGQPSLQTAADAPRLQDPAATGAIPQTDASREFGSAGVSPQSKVYTPDEAVVNIAALHSKDGGSTFNLSKGSLSGTPHYAVSIYPERGVTVPGKDVPPEAFRQFIEDNADLLKDPKNSIGTWFNPDDGKTYLDISVTTPDLDEALALGKAKGQLAIFDLNKFETIPVAQAGDTPLARQMEGTSNPEFHSVHPEGTAFSRGGTAPKTTGEVVNLPRKDETLDAMRRVDAARRFAAATTREAQAKLVRELRAEGFSVAEINALRPSRKSDTR